jgi:hypothetical protein
VNVQARENVTKKTFGAAVVTISPLPVIDRVLYRSMPDGSYSVVAFGTGFQRGAVVRSGTTALKTSFSAATRLNATSITPPSASALISVLNPDGGISNSMPLPPVQPYVALAPALPGTSQARAAGRARER